MRRFYALLTLRAAVSWRRRPIEHWEQGGFLSRRRACRRHLRRRYLSSTVSAFRSQSSDESGFAYLCQWSNESGSPYLCYRPFDAIHDQCQIAGLDEPVRNGARTTRSSSHSSRRRHPTEATAVCEATAIPARAVPSIEKEAIALTLVHIHAYSDLIDAVATRKVQTIIAREASCVCLHGSQKCARRDGQAE